MDDLATGKRTSAGTGLRTSRQALRQSGHSPPEVGKVLKWLPQYFFPYDILWIASALVCGTSFWPDVR